MKHIFSENPISEKYEIALNDSKNTHVQLG